MIKAITEIVKNLAVIILLTSFLDMLLPNTNLRRFIKVIMGLFIMVTILNPILSLINNKSELSAWQFKIPETEETDTVLAQGKKITLLQNSEALKEYEERIENQIKALIKLIPEVKDSNCDVTIEPSDKIDTVGKVREVNLKIFLAEMKENSTEEKSFISIEPVKINIDGKKVQENIPKGYSQIETKAKNIISNYFSIKENLITVEVID